MKRLSLYLFLILFTLPTPSQANDIRDFQIEGMSIGDSLLDYFSEEKIKKSKRKNAYRWKKDRKFTSIEIQFHPSFKIYDAIQVHFKDGDNKYIIGTLDGHIYYKNNIEDCYKKMDEIEIEISKIFKNTKKKRDISKHQYDKSEKSIATSVEYWFESGDIAVLECMDWSKQINLIDKLTLKIGTKEFVDWINNEAY